MSALLCELGRGGAERPPPLFDATQSANLLAAQMTTRATAAIHSSTHPSIHTLYIISYSRRRISRVLFLKVAHLERPINDK